MEALAWLLSLILQPCYAISGNWWIAILLFTIIVKIILIPMSLWCQKNSIVMVHPPFPPLGIRGERDLQEKIVFSRHPSTGKD